MVVPVELLHPILDDLLQYGRVNRPARPWLGLYAMQDDEAIVVGGLADGGPADKAGVHTGDRIAAVNDAPVEDLAGLWRDEERYRKSYLSAFDGFYLTGDSGYVDADGYVFVLGRSDDVINVAGHRLSTGSIEAVVASHPAVAECAVIGVADPLKGQRPSGYVVLKSGVPVPEPGSEAEAALLDELRQAVRREVGPVADFRDVVVVDALPKTRSGKILRKTMRQMADGQEAPVPSACWTISASTSHTA